MKKEKINKKKGINFKVGDAIFYVLTKSKGVILQHLGNEYYLIKCNDTKYEVSYDKIVKF